MCETGRSLAVFSLWFAGYVQTPGFDGVTRSPLNMNSWLKIPVPFHHSVMISFAHLYLSIHASMGYGGKIAIYTHHLSASDMRLYINSRFRPDPRLYDTSVLFVHYWTVQPPLNTRGFQMLFSFHNSSARPQKLTKDTWNCSVFFWSDFDQHFPCNLHKDCVNGEDEKDCPYTHPRCGAGRLSIGSR